VQLEDGHCQASKHVVVPYVENALYFTNKYCFFRRENTLLICTLVLQVCRIWRCNKTTV